MTPLIWEMGEVPWLMEYTLTLPSEWPEYTMGSTALQVTTFTLFPQLIEFMLDAFYTYHILICLSSEPLMHFSLVEDHVTPLIFYPWPTNEWSCFPVEVEKICILLSVEPANKHSPA